MTKNNLPPKGTKNLLTYFSAAAKTKSNAETSPNGVEGTAAKSPAPSTSNKQVPDTQYVDGPSNKSTISAKPNSFVPPTQKSKDAPSASAARSLVMGMAETGKTETGTSKMTGTLPDNNKKRKSEEILGDGNLKDGKHKLSLSEEILVAKTGGKPTSAAAVSTSSTPKPKKDKKKKSKKDKKKKKKRKSSKGGLAEDEPVSPSLLEKARKFRDGKYTKHVRDISIEAASGALGMAVGRKRIQQARKKALGHQEQVLAFSLAADDRFNLPAGTVSPAKNPAADAEIEKIAHLSSQPEQSDSSSSDSSNSGSESEDESESK